MSTKDRIEVEGEDYFFATQIILKPSLYFSVDLFSQWTVMEELFDKTTILLNSTR